MTTIAAEIEGILNRETHVWNAKNVDLLLTVFHDHMVWSWFLDTKTHNPLKLILKWGRFDSVRWQKLLQELFDTLELVHNIRTNKRSEVFKKGDGASTVVDIITLWRDKSGNENHWMCRTCKIYSKVQKE